MANIGHYISGAGHVGLIGYILVGPLFSSEPLPFEAANISVVTSEEFAALSAPVVPPAPSVLEPETPPQPVVEDETPPPAPAQEDVVPEDTAPEPAPAPVAEEVPEAPAPPAPVETPQEEVAAPVAPEAVDAPELPELAPEVTQRPAQRVAPEPVAQPEPDTTIAEETREAVTPDESAEAAEVEQEPQDATAPEAASTEIVTEANEGENAAPARSIRPPARPSRPAPQVAEAEPAAEPETPPSDATSDAVSAALEEALSAPETPAAPAGPPLTSGEREGLIIAVQDCWVVDVGSPAADVVVTVAMEMNRDGTIAGGVRMISAEGGDARAQEVAFQAARRAVLRCQSGGYDLPADKYEQWKEIEITFNPERMRVR